MKHAAIYTRVSSRTQDTKSQKPDLDRWVAAQDKPVKWFTDKFTGKSMDRPGWNKLIAVIKSGEIDTIVVWRLDRLGRTAKGLTALFAELVERRINLVSIKDGVDLSTPAGRMLANVLASVAQFETEVRGERILAGQQVARAKGKKWGGSKEGRRWQVTPEKEAVIHRMHAEGEKIAVIARTVALSRQTIYAWLGK